MRVLSLVMGLSVLACGCGSEQPEARPERDNTAATQRDNTAVNQRDADGSMTTPFDQSNDQADIDLVAQIRTKVLDIEDLSVNGRNVKIITNQRKVMLRGPVGSAAERASIVKVAQDIAGAGNVTDQLEVEAH